MHLARNFLLLLSVVVIAFSAGLRAELQKTTFPITFELQKTAYQGQANLTQNMGAHGETITRLSGKVDNPLPAEYRVPDVEEILESGGLTLTRTQPALVEEGKQSLIRISEYGTFLDLKELVADIARSGKQPADISGREYRSAFVLLHKPSSITRVEQVPHKEGSQLTLWMSDQSRLVFTLDNQFLIAALGVSRE